MARAVVRAWRYASHHPVWSAVMAGVILALLGGATYKAVDVADPLFDGDAETTTRPTVPSSSGGQVEGGGIFRVRGDDGAYDTILTINRCERLGFAIRLHNAGRESLWG